MDKLRGSGRTTAQMLAAPPNAVFVWCNGAGIKYAKELSRKLGRTDLTVVSPDWITSEVGWRGRRFSDIIVDHALWEALPKNSVFPQAYRQALVSVR